MATSSPVISRLQRRINHLVIIFMLSFALLVMLAIVLNFDRSTVNHALQNTQNYCHLWLSHTFRVHQIRLGRLHPGFAGGAYSAPPGRLAGLRGPTSKGKGSEWEGRGRKGRGGKRMGEKERGKGGKGRPLTQIPGSAPWYLGTNRCLWCP